MSIFDSWKIVRDFGCPNVNEYGGMSMGVHMRWMDGYEKYYHSMTNRLHDFYSIDISTPEGIEIIKHWLVHHMNEDETGGVANIMIASQGEQSETIPFGSAESGKDIIIGWGEWVGHQITIVGYNDAIKYDFNNDGQYTNDVDINNDGVVDVQDWEWGAYKVANSWGENWGENGGYKYMMYRLGAIEGKNGGLWGKSAFVINATEAADPLLTMKIKLKHLSRHKVKITAGVSTNPDAISPDHILEFPIFQNQGGDFYMQGSTIPTAQTIEFGLDISPLLSYVDAGETAKFFLLINENDPNNEDDGEIVNYSIIDYTNGGTETSYEGSVIPLNNNTLT
ncbi:MAG: hypothetical protein KAR20_03445, partial [Candidatus Heimdallarchaeota archaeon]|nr:hypothetical protein [Candidatus Heimdallarchaeota archaeon]